MKIKYFIFSLALLLSQLSYSQSSSTASNGSSSSSAATNTDVELADLSIKPLGETLVQKAVPVQHTYDLISHLAKAGKLNRTLANSSIDFINKLLEEKRLDSDGVYKFTRSVRNNLMAALDYLHRSNDLDEHAKKLDYCLSEAMTMTEMLRDSSYVDDIHSNKNFSYFIKTRLNNLIASSSLLAAQDHESTYKRLMICEDFRQELGVVEDKYRDTFRFRAGLGVNYTYLPSIRYFNTSTIDISPYQPVPSKTPDRLIYQNRFADQGYPGLMLMADIGIMGINVTIPDYAVNSNIVLPVDVINYPGENGLSNPFALYQTSIKSKLSINYDGYIRLDAIRVADRVFKRNYSQISAGFLYGAVGFAIKDEIMGDLRFADSQQPFNELPPSKEYIQNLSESYISQYWGVFARLNLTDEWMLGIDYKSYLNDHDDQDRVEVGGRSFGFSVLYIPTGL